jgi:hypothetical protein
MLSVNVSSPKKHLRYFFFCASQDHGSNSLLQRVITCSSVTAGSQDALERGFSQLDIFFRLPCDRYNKYEQLAVSALGCIVYTFYTF